MREHVTDLALGLVVLAGIAAPFVVANALFGPDGPMALVLLACVMGCAWAIGGLLR